MARLAAILLVGLFAAACSSSGGSFGTRSGTPSSTTGTAAGAATRGASSEGDSVAIYLRTLRDLIEGDPVLQADAFRRAEEAASTAPTTTNRLNVALALATPGHPSSNALEAQKQLTQLLASGDSLLPEERTLALIHLKEVEQRLILDAEAQRLQRAAQAATATQRNDGSAQRLTAALVENKLLRAQLDEARAKLDQITNIERSIRERENGANPQ
jgi:hypothetical protein